MASVFVYKKSKYKIPHHAVLYTRYIDIRDSVCYNRRGNSEKERYMEAKNDIMISYRFPRWDDLPVFELYVDQVCALLNERLSPIMKLMGEETPLTPAMVNN